MYLSVRRVLLVVEGLYQCWLRELREGLVGFKEEVMCKGIGVDWTHTKREGYLQEKVLKLEKENLRFPWYQFGIGWCCGTLFWTVLHLMFGG